MDSERLKEQLTPVAALVDPVRRGLYAYVTGQPHGVSKAEAAEALGISRELAAHHLDRLEDEGLLEASFRRLSGRRGPGAGRPAKLYRPSGRQVQLSLPPRNYELAATIFSEALALIGRPGSAAAVAKVALEFGERLGREARRLAGSRPSRKALLESARRQLGDWGFEPYPGPRDEVCLRNCPFQSLSGRRPELTCGAMNLPFLEGFLTGLGMGAALEAELKPSPDGCCVLLHPARRRGASSGAGGRP